MKLPGTGAPKDENCGVWTSLAVCSADPQHSRVPLRKSCNRLECPECHPRVLTRSAESVALRVDGYRRAIEGQQDLSGAPVQVRDLAPRHWLISPSRIDVESILRRVEKTLTKKWGKAWSQDDWDRAVITRIRERAYELIDVADLRGAAVIFHPYRIRQSKKHIIEREISKLPNPIKYWEWVRLQPNWRDYVKFSPHFHLMAYGTAIPTDEFYARTGAIIKMVREVDDTAALAYYLLSHAPVVNNRLQTTYRGCLSTDKLKVEKEWIDKEHVECPTCGALMVWTRVDEHMDIIEVLHDRPLYRKVRHREYVIVDPGGG